MGANLDTLMGLPGAVAAGKFSDTGELLEVKGEMPEDLARMAAMMCAANNLTAKMQTEGFTKMSGMNWTPLRGWAVAGGDYAICVEGNYGVIVELAKADFNEIFKTLSEVARA